MPAVVDSATVAEFVVIFVPPASFSCTVMVEVDVPLAVIDADDAVIVEVAVDGPLTVKVIEPVVALRYEASAAFVAEMVHVPPEVCDKVAPESEQLAVPAATSVYDTEPLPLPPEIASVVVLPKVAEVAAKLSVA